MHFQRSKHGTYIGHVEPGEACLIEKSGKMTYLVSQVEFNESTWSSLDEGLDTQNKKKVYIK